MTKPDILVVRTLRPSKLAGIEGEFRLHRYDKASDPDILVVAVPGGPGTEGLIDAAALEALGATGTPVNISRGKVVDEAALVAALKSGALGSAGLDVFHNEPNPDPELTSLANAVLSPHHANGTAETRDAMAALVNDNLRAHFSGREALTRVNEVPSSVAVGG